ncbi:hypothetical protein NDN08_002888 [Rhodosorus marinus]|uniref:[histone H3]-lysine(4) N-trimethyltransferase n=1 Tax=Rhodosorus marinus TaxID=101924 RepID=A0AAV8UUZ7_9RHOD|nr:hypothetical protein NDN08_002888 [Rhodosorus marinus]
MSHVEQKQEPAVDAQETEREKLEKPSPPTSSSHFGSDTEAVMSKSSNNVFENADSHGRSEYVALSSPRGADINEESRLPEKMGVQEKRPAPNGFQDSLNSTEAELAPRDDAEGRNDQPSYFAFSGQLNGMEPERGVTVQNPSKRLEATGIGKNVLSRDHQPVRMGMIRGRDSSKPRRTTNPFSEMARQTKQNEIQASGVQAQSEVAETSQEKGPGMTTLIATIKEPKASGSTVFAQARFQIDAVPGKPELVSATAANEVNIYMGPPGPPEPHKLAGDEHDDSDDMDIEEEVPGTQDTRESSVVALKRILGELSTGEAVACLSTLRGDDWRFVGIGSDSQKGIRKYSVRGYVDVGVPAQGSNSWLPLADPRERASGPVRKLLGVLPRYGRDENDPTDDERVLLLSNLNNNVTERFLQQEFSNYGKVAEVKVYRHKGAHAGIAHVRFCSRRESEVALKAFRGRKFLGRSLEIEVDPLFKKANVELERLRKRDEDEEAARVKRLQEDEERRKTIELEKAAERQKQIEQAEEKKRKMKEEQEKQRKQREEAQLHSKLGDEDQGSTQKHARNLTAGEDNRVPSLPALRVAMLPVHVKEVDVKLFFVKYGCIKVQSTGPFWIVVFTSKGRRDFCHKSIRGADDEDRLIRGSRFGVFMHTYEISRGEEMYLLGKVTRPPISKEELLEDTCSLARRVLKEAVFKEIRDIVDNEAVNCVSKTVTENERSRVRTSSLSAMLNTLPKLGFQYALKKGDVDAQQPGDAKGKQTEVQRIEKGIPGKEGTAERREIPVGKTHLPREARRSRYKRKKPQGSDDDETSGSITEELIVEGVPTGEDISSRLRKRLSPELKEAVSEVSEGVSSEEAEDSASDAEGPREEPLIENPSGCARTEPYRKVDPLMKSSVVEDLPSIEIKDSAHQTWKRGAVRGLRRNAGLHCEVSSLLSKLSLKTQRKNLRAGKSRIHGLGLYAVESIEAGEYVVEYIGELVRNSVADSRERMYQRLGMGDSYMFRVSEEAVVDATRNGALSRYINHSCEPNVDARIIEVQKEPKIVFYSKRRLAPGEEITYDYKFELEDDDEKISCLCRSKNCRGYLN